MPWSRAFTRLSQQISTQDFSARPNLSRADLACHRVVCSGSRHPLVPRDDVWQTVNAASLASLTPVTGRWTAMLPGIVRYQSLRGHVENIITAGVRTQSDTASGPPAPCHGHDDLQSSEHGIK
jgi:hypothetical protein